MKGINVAVLIEVFYHVKQSHDRKLISICWIFFFTFTDS